MKILTSRFGAIEIDETAVLTFPSGLLGFPRFTRWVLLDHDREAPFQWLQAVDRGDLAFIVMDPLLVKPDYRIAIAPREVADLGEAAGEDYRVFVILTVPSPDPARVTANLRGPLVLNRRTGLGKQIVLTEDLPTRYPVFPATADQPVGLERPVPVGASGR